MRKDVPGAGEDEVDSRYLIYHPQTRKYRDSLLQTDSAALKSKRIIGYRAHASFGRTLYRSYGYQSIKFGNSTLVEANSLAVGYLANVGFAGRKPGIFNET